MSEAELPEARLRRVTSFVQHRNRTTDAQQQAWEHWWPRYGRDVADVVSGTVPYDPPAWFGRTAPLVLEIGSGMGESTAAMAAAAPGTDHLAVEVFERGLARLLGRIDEADLHNLLLLRGDAVELLRAAVPPASLDGLRIYFPDPWPKRKHRKRRLVQPPFAALAASRLRPGGLLHLATDWADYAEQMRDVTAAEPMLENPHGGFAPRPDGRPVTKFERRARAEGREVRDLLLIRRSSSSAASGDRVGA